MLGKTGWNCRKAVPTFLFVFHEVKIDVTLGGTWEVLGRNMGGTFSFHLRYFFAFQSMPKRRSIEVKAKFYRTSIEHLSNIYRRPIEDLSKTYRTSIEECMCQLFYPPPMVCLLRRRMSISPSIFLLTDIFLLTHLNSVK